MYPPVPPPAKYLIKSKTCSGLDPGGNLFINSLIEIANKSGFKNSDSMVLQTFLGSILLLLSGQKKPSDLQKKVTSKGGTTEAALSILASNKGLKSLLTRAVNKATKRSRELSKIS